MILSQGASAPSEGFSLSPLSTDRPMLDLSHLPVVNDPNVPAWQARVRIIEKILPRLSGDAEDRLKRERRTLLRRIHDVPMSVQLPL